MRKRERGNKTVRNELTPVYRMGTRTHSKELLSFLLLFLKSTSIQLFPLAVELHLHVFLSTDSPWRNAGEKPAVPLKPAAISSTPLKHQTRHQSPSCISPPQPSKTSLDHTPSPPPPLASRKAELEDSGSTYVMLEDARTPNLPLGMCVK